MDNPLKILREHMGMNQHQFADLVGRSYASIQGYEAGKKIPPEVVERMKTIAAERGFADVALVLSSDAWQVRTLIHPPQEFAQRQGKQIQYAAIQDAGRQAQHALLDALLDSGNPDAAAAIDHLLRYFASTLATPKAAAKPARQRHAKP